MAITRTRFVYIFYVNVLFISKKHYVHRFTMNVHNKFYFNTYEIIRIKPHSRNICKSTFNLQILQNFESHRDDPLYSSIILLHSKLCYNSTDLNNATSLLRHCSGVEASSDSGSDSLIPDRLVSSW